MFGALLKSGRWKLLHSTCLFDPRTFRAVLPKWLLSPLLHRASIRKFYCKRGDHRDLYHLMKKSVLVLNARERLKSLLRPMVSFPPVMGAAFFLIAEFTGISSRIGQTCAFTSGVLYRAGLHRAFRGVQVDLRTASSGDKPLMSKITGFLFGFIAMGLWTFSFIMVWVGHMHFCLKQMPSCGLRLCLGPMSFWQK